MAKGPRLRAVWAAAGTAVAAAAVLLAVWPRQQPTNPPERLGDPAPAVSLVERLAPEPKPLNILILGVDADETRTDIILLARWDPGANQVSMVSLPRDSLVPIPCPAEVPACISPDKLGHAHAYGSVIGMGPALAIQTVEEFLGVRVDHYVRIHYDGFREIVDALGGITLEVEPAMVDHLELEAGPQRLNGEQALHYVRFRSDPEGDFGRQRRTQIFLRELALQVLESFPREELPGLVLRLMGKVETNLDAAALLAALRHVVEGGQTPAFRGTSLPGSPHWERDLWFWTVDEAAAAAIIQEYINTPETVEVWAQPGDYAAVP